MVRPPWRRAGLPLLRKRVLLTTHIQPAAGKPGADGRRSLHYDLVTAVPELRSDRIVLNAHNNSEVAAHLAGEDEETARRFGWWPAYSTEETVRGAYANWARNWQEDGPGEGVRDPGSGALVGGCELRIGPDGTGEVSYWTHAGKRGGGMRAALWPCSPATRPRSASPAWKHTSPRTTTPHGMSPKPPGSPRRAPSRATTEPK